MPGGKWVKSADTVEKCKTACINDTTCIAIDWDPFDMDECQSHNASGATVNAEYRNYSTFYQLNRGCLG